MPIGDSSHQISVVVHQHAQLVVFPELEPLAEVFAAEPELAVRQPGVARGRRPHAVHGVERQAARRARQGCSPAERPQPPELAGLPGVRGVGVAQSASRYRNSAQLRNDFCGKAFHLLAIFCQVTADRVEQDHFGAEVAREKSRYFCGRAPNTSRNTAWRVGVGETEQTSYW
jgi:hypothetical protein